MEQKETKQAILVLEKEEEKSSKSFNERNKESARKVLFENNAPQNYMENLKNGFSPKKKEEKKVSPKIEFSAEKTFSTQPNFENAEEKTEQVQEPVKKAEQVQELVAENVQQDFQRNLEISEKEENKPEEISQENCEDADEEVFERENKSKKAKPKTRFRIFVFGLVGVLACAMGWSIYNAIQIKTLTSEIEQANKIYSVNIAKYISNISKADDLTNPDSITNLDALSNAKILPLQPAKTEHVEYSIKSNWFDRLCNWISNIFK